MLRSGPAEDERALEQLLATCPDQGSALVRAVRDWIVGLVPGVRYFVDDKRRVVFRFGSRRPAPICFLILEEQCQVRLRFGGTPTSVGAPRVLEAGGDRAFLIRSLSDLGHDWEVQLLRVAVAAWKEAEIDSR